MVMAPLPNASGHGGKRALRGAAAGVYRAMTNGIAAAMFLALAGLVALDAYLYDWGNTLFLARKGTEAIRFLAFWR